MIRVGIIGAKGYTAGELMRMLARHPGAEMTCLMARVGEPEPVEKYFPALRGVVKTLIEPMNLDKVVKRCDAVFLALPHTTAQEYAPALIEGGVKVIDLSADFRFDDVVLYEQTYKVKHLAPELNAKLPYAMPELFKDEMTGVPGLANPGCYTTASILGLAPLMHHPNEVILDHIVINAYSGVSGAGRKPNEGTHYPECNESIKPYGVASHRHRPEIEEKLSRLAGREIRVAFTPHLAPMTRGILASISIPMQLPFTIREVHAWYEDFFKDQPFVRVLPKGEFPATAAVSMTNYCDIGVAVDGHSSTLLIFSAIDNLVKGASGQAIQGMNVLFGLDEAMGL